MTPTIVRPFPENVFQDLKQHVKEVRRLFDWNGIPYHDDNEPENTEHPLIDKVVVGNKFNRWVWHRPPVIHSLHHLPELIAKASEICGETMKPSYSFLSMYGPEGVCPVHKDRPQCQFTMDLQINSNGDWPIYIERKEYRLKDGEALCYSGTFQEHYRKPMTNAWIKTESGYENKITQMDLAFFHFVPITWMGKVD